jgi:hypothetical protein
LSLLARAHDAKLIGMRDYLMDAISHPALNSRISPFDVAEVKKNAISLLISPHITIVPLPLFSF